MPWQHEARTMGHTMLTKNFYSNFHLKLSIKIKEKYCLTSGNRTFPLMPYFWSNFGQCQDTTFLSFLKGLFDQKFFKYVIGLGIDRLFQSVRFQIPLIQKFLIIQSISCSDNCLLVMNQPKKCWMNGGHCFVPFLMEIYQCREVLINLQFPNCERPFQGLQYLHISLGPLAVF